MKTKIDYINNGEIKFPGRAALTLTFLFLYIVPMFVAVPLVTDYRDLATFLILGFLLSFLIWLVFIIIMMGLSVFLNWFITGKADSGFIENCFETFYLWTFSDWRSKMKEDMKKNTIGLLVKE
jgi:small-conductance mechanosensitive channel